MITIYSEDHKLRDAKTELCGGQLIRPHERPSRAELIIARVHETGLGVVRSPSEFELDPVLRVHDAGFVSFLERAWSLWAAEGHGGEEGNTDLDLVPGLLAAGDLQVLALRRAGADEDGIIIFLKQDHRVFLYCYVEVFISAVLSEHQGEGSMC